MLEQLSKFYNRLFPDQRHSRSNWEVIDLAQNWRFWGDTNTKLKYDRKTLSVLIFSQFEEYVQMFSEFRQSRVQQLDTILGERWSNIEQIDIHRMQLTMVKKLCPNKLISRRRDISRPLPVLIWHPWFFFVISKAKSDYHSLTV